MTSDLIITPFTPADQAEAKALILAGMEEHWGFIDPTLNPDLNDIAASYAGRIFLVARLDGHLVATGALKNISTESAEIVRMSVAGDVRRQHIGRRMIDQLVNRARAAGCRKVILETTGTWQDVVEFYLRAGFTRTYVRDGDQYFEMILT